MRSLLGRAVDQKRQKRILPATKKREKHFIRIHKMEFFQMRIFSEILVFMIAVFNL